MGLFFKNHMIPLSHFDKRLGGISRCVILVTITCSFWLSRSATRAKEGTRELASRAWGPRQASGYTTETLCPAMLKAPKRYLLPRADSRHGSKNTVATDQGMEERCCDV